jgi:hypothetical protein
MPIEIRQATLDGPTTFARIGMLRVLNRKVRESFQPRPQKTTVGVVASWRGPPNKIQFNGVGESRT